MTVEQNEFLNAAQLQSLAEQAMRYYPTEYQGEIKLLCQSENATFIIRNKQHCYALRIHRPNYHSRLNILSELEWLDALNQSGIAVPLAIADSNDQLVITLKLSDEIIRYAVLFHWIAGTMPTIEVDPTAFQQLGNITAKLHLHSKQWQPSDTFTRIIWDHETMLGPQAHWGDWRNAPHLQLRDHDIINESIAKIANKLGTFGKTADRYGLIHADLRLTNLLLQEQHIGVIDFDDCGMSWFMHDLAAAISFNEHHASAPHWIEQWLKGYETIAHISVEEYALIPTFIMQRRIQMMAWNGSHMQTEMALSLGEQWSNETVRLCKKYLADTMPVGL